VRPRKSPPARKRATETDRREKLLDTAEAVFFRNGFQATSMDLLAKEAGMSKRTVYEIFATKEDLFEALIAREATQVDEIFAGAQADSGSVEGDLAALLHNLAEEVLQPDKLGYMWLMIAERERAPKLVQTFEQRTLGRALRQIELMLERQQAKGRLVIDDLAVACSCFIGMAFGVMHTRALLGILPTRAEIDAHMAETVRIFLARYAAPAKGRKKG
jgi:TetR/AcrR family transcriptional regulator of autoinduction and epiphytic fitness